MIRIFHSTPQKILAFFGPVFKRIFFLPHGKHFYDGESTKLRMSFLKLLDSIAYPEGPQIETGWRKKREQQAGEQEEFRQLHPAN